MSVISKHKDYDAMHERWVMCRDAAEGEHAVHLKREAYLPRLKDEEDDSYKLRLMMTPFFNATWRTITGLRGMLFRKPPKAELTTRITDAELDIDLAGTTLLSLAQEVVEEALIVGRVGLLVDFPPANPGTTLADQKAAGLRTLISLYKAESIYNWDLDRVNGATVLCQVRLTEEFSLETEDEFESKCEKRYRVLDLDQGKYRQRVYRVDEKGVETQVGEDIIPLVDGEPLPFIPFVVMGVDDVGMDVDAPPLIDLVTTNFHHYLQATSYERGCFFSGLPTMFISGMEDSDKEISIGGNVANALGSPNAKAYYVEVSSKFEALRTNLEDKKKEMAVLGARMLEGSRAGGQTEAAETVARRQSGEESVLSSIAQNISQGLEQALNWFTAWEGQPGEVTYQLNRDFLPTSMSAQDLGALVSAWQQGAISPQTLFDNLKAGEIIDDKKTFEDESAQIAEQAPQMGTMPAVDPATGLPVDPSTGLPQV